MNFIKILLILLILVGAVIAVGIFRSTTINIAEEKESSVLERVKDEKIIRVGYAAYPPYVIKDLNTEELSGYYIDIVNELAVRAGWEIEWVETTWDTYISDLQTGKFDVINDPMFPTIPRLQQINFTSPLGYFVDMIGLVRVNGTNYTNIQDLNSADVTIAVPQGWTTEEYAKKNLPNANIKVFPGASAALVFADVVAGNADVALVDGLSVQQYLEQNKNQDVKALFLDNPPVITAASWGVRKGDTEWLLFLNGAIEKLRSDGTLESLAKKYKLYSYEVDTQLIPQ